MDFLSDSGDAVGRLAVATLMRRMGIEALYRRPGTSKPASGAQDLPVSAAQPGGGSAEPGLGNGRHPRRRRRTQTARGFAYLAAVVDCFSRRVLAWRLSITLGAEFCLDAVNEALARHGKLASTDQGSQCTSAVFTELLLEKQIAISMVGRGAWRNNVFVERSWRPMKYEEVYLRTYNSPSDARASLGRYLDFYNSRRPHSSLGARTPEQACLDQMPRTMAA